MPPWGRKGPRIETIARRRTRGAQDRADPVTAAGFRPSVEALLRLLEPFAGNDLDRVRGTGDKLVDVDVAGKGR